MKYCSQGGAVQSDACKSNDIPLLIIILPLKAVAAKLVTTEFEAKVKSCVETDRTPLEPIFHLVKPGFAFRALVTLVIFLLVQPLVFVVCMWRCIKALTMAMAVIMAVVV